VDTPDARLGSFDKIYSENVGQLYKESGSGLQDTRAKSEPRRRRGSLWRWLRSSQPLI